MKKAFIGIIATIFVMVAIFGGILGFVTGKYQRTISDMEENYSEATEQQSHSYELLYKACSKSEEDCSVLEARYDELQSDVYDVMTGNSYDICVEHDGCYYIWIEE